MSTELDRRLKSIEQRVMAAAAPCPVHFPAIIYSSSLEQANEAIEVRLAEMADCERCEVPKWGFLGPPIVIAIGYPSRSDTSR